MKTIKHSMLYVRDPKTGQFQSLQAIVGESAYEIAVRLGTFSGTEEEWANITQNERDAAIQAIQKKGAAWLKFNNAIKAGFGLRETNLYFPL